MIPANTDSSALKEHSEFRTAEHPEKVGAPLSTT